MTLTCIKSAQCMVLLESLVLCGCNQRRYDMRHKMLTQRALFCHRANTKRGTLTQHFVTHVVPPLGCNCPNIYFTRIVVVF